VAPNSNYEDYAAKLMTESQYRLDENSRREVLDAIVRHSKRKRWRPVAVHIRSTHCHSVIEAGNAPSKRMRDQFKVAASRSLNQNVGRVAKRWSRGGSCRCLWKPADLAAAVDYVLNRQGKPMATYFDEEAYSRLMEG
jgi:REP element-mobilizing transposase RayT